MKVITKRVERFSGKLIAKGNNKSHQIWLLGGVIAVVLIIGVLLYASRSDALFGKGIDVGSLQQGTLQEIVAPACAVAGNPVAWWPAWVNASDGVASDRVGSNDGEVSGRVVYTTGKVAKAFGFASRDPGAVRIPSSLISYPQEGGIIKLRPFSIEFWFKTGNINRRDGTTLYGNGVMFSQTSSVRDEILPDLSVRSVPENGYVPAIYVGTDGKLYVQAFWFKNKTAAAPGFEQVISTDRVDDGKFHHVAVTFGATRVSGGQLFFTQPPTETVYLDGVRIGLKKDIVQVPYAREYEYRIGTGYTGQDAENHWPETTGKWMPFAGAIDEVTIYDRILAPIEVRNIYNANYSGKCICTDADRDGYCAESSEALAPIGKSGWGDCNDGNNSTNPGAEEVCGDVDNNCDGSVNICIDTDTDGTPDNRDNCPAVANVDQADANSDGVGDACDGSGDGDVLKGNVYTDVDEAGNAVTQLINGLDVEMLVHVFAANENQDLGAATQAPYEGQYYESSPVWVCDNGDYSFTDGEIASCAEGFSAEGNVYTDVDEAGNAVTQLINGLDVEMLVHVFAANENQDLGAATQAPYRGQYYESSPVWVCDGGRYSFTDGEINQC